MSDYCNSKRDELIELYEKQMRLFDDLTNKIYRLTRLDSGGVGLIARERERQVVDEGWSDAHDASHNNAQLAAAAYCYLTYGNCPRWSNQAPAAWPWDDEFWKPKHDRIRNLTIAGALIAAEIDRLTKERARDDEDRG